MALAQKKILSLIKLGLLVIPFAFSAYGSHLVPPEEAGGLLKRRSMSFASRSFSPSPLDGVEDTAAEIRGSFNLPLSLEKGDSSNSYGHIQEKGSFQFRLKAADLRTIGDYYLDKTGPRKKSRRLPCSESPFPIYFNLEGDEFYIKTDVPIGRGASGTIHYGVKYTPTTKASAPLAIKIIDINVETQKLCTTFDELKGLDDDTINPHLVVAAELLANRHLDDIQAHFLIDFEDELHPQPLLDVQIDEFLSPEDGQRQIHKTLFMPLGIPLTSMAESFVLTGKEEDISENLRNLQILLRDLMKNMVGLRRRGVIHRDIKASNVVFDGKVFRLIDFDLSKRASSITDGHKGTLAFKAPEETDLSYEADLWTLAKAIFAYISGQSFVLPSHSREEAIDQVEAFFKTRSEFIADPVTQIELSALEDFLLQFLSTRRKHRPTAEMGLAHPFLASSKPYAFPPRDPATPELSDENQDNLTSAIQCIERSLKE